MRISLSQAIQTLQEGQVVAVPTETVYGLAACLNQPAAIAQIFNLKRRPLANPLIIHVADVQDIACYATAFPPDFEKLAHDFWPGALTCILPIQEVKVPSLVRAGLPTAGFRVPVPQVTRDLLQATGPLVMPSANLSGRPSATRPEHIEEDFGLDFPVLDGGVCVHGLESTILLYQDNEWGIVRLGVLAPNRFESVLGYTPRLIKRKLAEQPVCPGQLFRHYSPRAQLVLGDPVGLIEAPFILGFKERHYPVDKRVIVLGSLFNPEEVAENLYQALRQLDQEGASQAWVDMDFPQTGLWQTIAERLLRAGEGETLSIL
jgi:L-threonylcarbamoyladenylate synthase